MSCFHSKGVFCLFLVTPFFSICLFVFSVSVFFVGLSVYLSMADMSVCPCFAQVFSANLVRKSIIMGIEYNCRMWAGTRTRLTNYTSRIKSYFPLIAILTFIQLFNKIIVKVFVASINYKF